MIYSFFPIILLIEYENHVRVNKTIARFGDWLAGLTGLRIQSYSQLGFITVKGCKAQSAKGTGTWSEVWRESDPSFWESSPSEVSEDMLNSSSSKLWQHGYWRSLLETRCPRFFLESRHIVMSAWHVPKFESLRRKAGVQHKPHCLCKQFWGSYQFWQWWERASNPNIHTLANAQTFKQGFLRIAVSGLLLTLCCTETKYIKLFRFLWVLKLFFPF